MNRSEAIARTWIMNHYDIKFDDIVFQSSISPDFIIKHSNLNFEVKSLKGKTITLPYSQWQNLLSYPNCLILVFNHSSQPIAIIPFNVLQEGNNEIDGYTIKLSPDPNPNLTIFNIISISLRKCGLKGSVLWKEYRRIKPLCYTKFNGSMKPLNASAVYRIIQREVRRLEIDYGGSNDKQTIL